MQLVLHAGAHFTEEDRLVRCLLRNKEDFSKRGVSVPGPSKYRTLLKKTIAALQVAPPAPDARDVLLDVILDDENADRMILSQMFLFGAPRACARNGMIYEAYPTGWPVFHNCSYMTISRCSWPCAIPRPFCPPCSTTPPKTT